MFKSIARMFSDQIEEEVEQDFKRLEVQARLKQLKLKDKQRKELERRYSDVIKMYKFIESVILRNPPKRIYVPYYLHRKMNYFERELRFLNNPLEKFHSCDVVLYMGVQLIIDHRHNLRIEYSDHPSHEK